jgi:transcription elongation factor Elf1
MSVTVILVCPCCASAVDAHAADTPQQFTCLTCGQTWSMVVDAERQDTYSLT